MSMLFVRCRYQHGPLIQAHGEALRYRAVPSDNGGVTQGETSGSTGRPIACLNIEATLIFGAHSGCESTFGNGAKFNFEDFIAKIGRWA